MKKDCTRINCRLLCKMAPHPLNAAVLMLFAASASAQTIIGPSTSEVTVSSDTNYQVDAGTTIAVAQGNAVTVTGIAPVVFSNAGTISGPSGGAASIRFNVPSTFTNEATGNIYGGTYGVRMTGGGTSNVINRGDISVMFSHAIYYEGSTGGSIDNFGTLNSGRAGAVAPSATGITFVSSGSVSINNHAGASILSGTGNADFGLGINLNGAGTVSINNDGTILGYLGAIRNTGPGVMALDNRSTGVIRGDRGPGVELRQGDGIVNRGMIGSDTGPAILLAGGNNSVVLGTGSVLDGSGAQAIVSQGTNNTLWLAETGSEAGSFTASPGNGFASLTSELGSTWVLTGDVALGGSTAGALRVDGDLTLGGTVSQEGGGGITITSGGRLVLGTGGAGGMAAGNAANQGELVFHRTDNPSFDGVITGPGKLTQQGPGTTTLTASGSSQGAVEVQGGTLAFAQSGAFSAGTYATDAGATTSIAANATLGVSSTLTQAAGSTLAVTLGSTQPIVTAGSATLDGALHVDGFSTTAPNTASALTSTNFRILQTTAGISGDFNSVSFGGASPVDYLTLTGAKSTDNLGYDVGFGLTWLGGPAAGNGVFTLANATDTFNVDVQLANQSGTFASGWDGRTLTKQGAGTLILSVPGTYTGDTLVNGGTLRAGVADALAASANVGIASGATLDLNGFDQHVNNLSGAGNVALGSATLAAVNAADTAFAGVIAGTGSLVKQGTGTLTLSGANTFSGGTTVEAGRLVATNGTALGTGGVLNNAALQLDFAQDSVLANTLTGTGGLTKTGAGMATLNGTGSTQGTVSVDAGELRFVQAGTFSTTGNFTTAAGGTTSISAQSPLAVGNQFAMDGTLNIKVGALPASVTANTATLGSGSTFNMVGFSAPDTASASALADSRVTVIHTEAPNGLSGQFQSVRIAGTDIPVDFVTLGNVYTGQDFVVGLGLNWYAEHASLPQTAHGTFTLIRADGEFDIDVVLADQAANAATGWDGKSLTKAGPGTLQLSKANTYTGSTWINEGTLRAGADNVMAQSGQVAVAAGATFDLNGFNQIANNLSGAGNVALGGGTLTANNLVDTAWDGVIGGSGGLNKTGAANLTLSASQTYSGDTAVNAGALVLGNGAQLANTPRVTVAQGATLGGYGGVGGSVTNNGLLAVADAAPGFANGPAGTFVVGGALVNSGEIRMGSPVPASTLTVNGDYTGNNGKLTLYTALGGDASATDRLVVHGNTAGQTTVKVQNAGGAGAQTVNGIRIVQVDGQSNGVFALDGRLVAGAYDYGLYKGGVQTPDDGDWYLRASESNPNPVPRPETGTYLANRAAAQGMFVHTFHDRAGFVDPRSADGKATDTSNGWARVTGGHADGNASGGRISESADTFVAQAGIDLLHRVSGNQRWQAGVMAGYGTATTHASAQNNPATARGTVNGGSAGIYGTWHGNASGTDGPYVDTWLQYGGFDNTVHGAQLGSESYSSHVWTGSVEGGWAFPIGYTGTGMVQVEPQLQLIYTDYQAGSHTESNGTVVQSRSSGGWTTRLGTRLFHTPNPGASPAWLPYVELNWWHNTGSGSMAFDNVVVAQDGPRDRVEAKVGAQVQVSQRWRMWGNVAYQYGNGGYESITGLLGVRYLW